MSIVPLISSPAAPDAGRLPLIPSQRAAFEQRLVQELPRLRRHALARHGAARAMDVVQETVLRALQRWQTFDQARPLWPWLRAISDHLAQRDSERARLAPATLAEAEHHDRRTVEAVSQGEGAEQELATLLARLAPADEAILRRHHLGGESIAELARALGRPSGTIKARLFRARKRLAAASGLLGLILLVARLHPVSEDPPEPGSALLRSSIRIERIEPAPPGLAVIEERPVSTDGWRVTTTSPLVALPSSKGNR